VSCHTFWALFSPLICSRASLTPTQFLPGQWLDVHVHGIPEPGGFTIISTPFDAQPNKTATQLSTASNDHKSGYLELAVQESPSNPAAAWLWRPIPDIINQELNVRVGGSFVWPPPNIDLQEVKRIVFVAGGVGVNPLVSIISHLAQLPRQPYTISFLYSVRDPGDLQTLSSILFLERLARLFANLKIYGELVLHVTSGEKRWQSTEEIIIEIAGFKLRCRRRRITKDDLVDVLGPVSQRQFTVVYVCGVPAMTDELVDVARWAIGMDPRKVFCERWW
jgi:NAD(P)H-flavin reductase